MGNKNVNSIRDFVPHFLYVITTGPHECPVAKLRCPGIIKTRQYINHLLVVNILFKITSINIFIWSGKASRVILNHVLFEDTHHIWSTNFADLVIVIGPSGVQFRE